MTKWTIETKYGISRVEAQNALHIVENRLSKTNDLRMTQTLEKDATKLRECLEAYEVGSIVRENKDD